MENEIITLAANGLQPERGSSSEDSLGSSASNTPPPPRTHDTTPGLYHLKDLKIFAKRLEAAAKATLPRHLSTQPRYQDVEVILMRWQGDDRLGVSCELEDLKKVFSRSYSFKTTEWLIPTENPLVDIMTKVLALIGQPGLENKLLIFYYAGHAAMNESRQQIWLRTGHWDEGSLEWFAVQPLLVNAKADVLFLLDCCAAASAAAPSNTTVGIKETIGACAFEARAPEPGPFSFTNTLIEVLDAWKWRPMFSAAMLHSELLARLKHPRPQRDRFGRMSEFRRSPVYVVTTTDPKAVSIELGRRILPNLDGSMDDQSSIQGTQAAHTADTVAPASESPPVSPISSPEDPADEAPTLSQPDSYNLAQLNNALPGGDLAVPHVLISLALEGEQLLEFDAWKSWMQARPEFAKCAKIEGIYKSHSTLLILSVPVVIWDWLPDDLACSFIGHVSSINHARDSSEKEHWDLRAFLRAFYEARYEAGGDTTQKVDSLLATQSGLMQARRPWVAWSDMASLPWTSISPSDEIQPMSEWSRWRETAPRSSSRAPSPHLQRREGRDPTRWSRPPSRSRNRSPMLASFSATDREGRPRNRSRASTFRTASDISFRSRNASFGSWASSFAGPSPPASDAGDGEEQGLPQQPLGQRSPSPPGTPPEMSDAGC